MRIAIIGIVICLVVIICVKKYTNYSRFISISKLADNGDTIALCKLATLYQYGIGTKKDMDKALQCFQKAIDLGSLDAIYGMGNCYLSQDPSKAILYFKMGAEQNHSASQYHLALCFDEGIGIQKNVSEAIFWYKKAAEQGNTDAQNNLGWIYQNGLGVPVDIILAIQYYKLAAAQGDSTAKANLTNLFQS